ncbi:MarR family transcriptional regulator [Apilactobacillus sp. TMW 2.2459]|uniref:MarR family winged helix-turn-helix transcriptional regulator n=1 Tax=Apilactobacillus xinyiensis TaxID=2841032 RepID=UPI001C7D4E5C|nr:MarR family transcriptional regulator [Apilactobacillus xinyiensis]MCL0312205.1 MarR family transcriptional regulator [Apilactobacillus xinyiensis]
MKNFFPNLKVADILLTKNLDNQTSQINKNLTGNQVIILFYLDDHKNEITKQVDIEKNLNISHSTTRGTVKRLIKSGFVKTSPIPEDKRQVQVVLTQQGQQLLSKNQSKLEKILSDTLAKAAKGLNDKDIDDLQRITSQIIKNLK